MNKSKLLHKILAGSKNISFDDMKLLAEAFGFRLARTTGSHHIFVDCTALNGHSVSSII